MFKKLFFLVIIIVFFLPGTAKATTISPLIFEVELEPGQSVQKIIKIFNETDSNLFLNGYLEIFRPKGERGEAEILPPQQTAYQAINWIKLPLNSLVLKPKEAVRAPLIIEVPKTADVGGYYLAAMWETSAGPKSKNNQVGLASRVGTLILLKVGDEAEEKLRLLDFGLKSKNNFYSHLPVSFFARLENYGNVHLQPQGSVIIKNIFGRATTVLPLNEEQRNILPQSFRRFEVDWQRGEELSYQNGFWPDLKMELKQFALGRFTAQLEIEYGQNHERIYSQEIYFWVAPWRLLTGGGLIIILFFIFFYIFKQKKKNTI